MPTVQEFFSTIRGVVRRGTALDSELPRVFRQSLRFIEQNYSLPYMRRRLYVTVAVDDEDLLISGSDGNMLKSIKMVRYQSSDGEFHRVKQVEPGDISSTDSDGNPIGYELYSEPQADGTQAWRLRFDTSWKEAVTLEIVLHVFTDWSGDEMAGNIWLLNHAEQALLARCMLNLAPIMRDVAVMQMYQQLWLEGVGVMIAAASELEQDNR